MRVAPNEREHAIVNLLRYFEARGAIVFCSTREAVRHLHANLLERGFRVVALSGELSQSERTRALQALRDGRARVCVATDVAARGLDLPDLGLVIHADLPNDRDTLLHRSGRTGRAGRKGTSVLVVAHTRRRRAERLLESAHVEAAWSDPPSADDIRERDRERMLREVATIEEPSQEDLGLGAGPPGRARAGSGRGGAGARLPGAPARPRGAARRTAPTARPTPVPTAAATRSGSACRSAASATPTRAGSCR